MNLSKRQGRGKYQIENAEKALTSILGVLNDEKEHRYSDIKKETGLADPTVTKYLNQFKTQELIQKRVDTKSGKYPYPAYYKIKPITKAVLEVISTTKQEKHEIEQIILDPKKTPLDVLDQINIKNNASILLTLKLLKENKDISPELLNLILRLFVWQPYVTLTSFLIEKSKKIIDKIDVESLIESNKSTIQVGKNSLKSLGLTDNEIDKLIDRQ